MTPTPSRLHRRPILTSTLLLLPIIATFGYSARAQDAGLKTLWQIGQADGNDAEFALAPGNYGGYSEDGFYAVGRSDSHKDWPFIQPGPSDGWAGGKAHSSQIIFGLRQAPAAACRLNIRVLDTQAATPPRLQVVINDFSQELQLPAGGGDAVLSGKFDQSKPYVWSIPVPATAIKTGTNRISISSVAGSWLVYDAVDFEAPAQTQQAPVAAVWVDSVEAQPFLVKDAASGALQQSVAARVRNFGPATQVTMRMNGQTQNVSAASGTGQIRFLASEVQTPTPSRLAVEVGGQLVADEPVTLSPVRHWTVYLLPHSHVDIGYTQPQEDVRKKQIANVREAINEIKRTADYPTDSQFKWNLEVLWPMEAYLEGATPAERQEVMDGIRSGKIILNGYYGNLLTGLTSPGELLRAFGPSSRVAAQAGVSLNAAMQDDTPGQTWGNVTAMSQAGVKYLSLGPNNGDRTGTSLMKMHDKPFYWEGPSGKERVLTWMSYGGYALALNIRKDLNGFLPGYLAELEETKYPYDISALHWCVNGDNGSPDEELPDAVRDWNATHAFPHLVIAGTSEPFVALEKRFAGKIPTMRGDFTPYWEDGAASTAQETVLRRNATDRLVQAQAIWAMQGRPDFPAKDFRAAWEDALLYSEHTWGAANSVSEPDAPFVKAEWAYKRDFALRADALSKKLLASAAGDSASGKIDVFNTSSWPRTDLVMVSAEQSSAGDRVTDAAGKSVASQRLASGELAILVRDLPPFSSRRFSILPGKALSAGAATARGNVISNGTLTARVDPQTGAIAELRMKGLPGNLVDANSQAGVNSYFYLRDTDISKVESSGPATVTVEDAGPLVATLRVESDAPGARRLTRRLRLGSGMGQLELFNTIDKLAIRDKEGVHIGFGFNVPNAVTRLDMPFSVVRPEADQLPGGNRNWYPVQHWVDVSNSQYGVTWATLDAPLVEVGGLTANIPGYVPQTDPRWIQKTASSSTFYSWAMNNHWHTNYKADQEGLVTFRYAIAPHGPFAPDAAARFGQGVARPLLAMPASSATPIKGSLLQVSSPGVTVAELKPSDDGTAWIVRLWGASGRNESVRLTWAGRPVTDALLSDTMENAGAKVGPIIPVAGYDLVTLRIPRD